MFNPIDLRGIPTANADKTLAVWLKPQIFQMDPSEGIVNILFLDEISAAPQSVQAAAYQMTLDRVVGEHRLPKLHRHRRRQQNNGQVGDLQNAEGSR